MLSVTLKVSPNGKKHYGEPLTLVTETGKVITLKVKQLTCGDTRVIIEAPEEIRILRGGAIRKAVLEQRNTP